jgi:hypothetical protein
MGQSIKVGMVRRGLSVEKSELAGTQGPLSRAEGSCQQLCLRRKV